jgi:hypothetical protein
MLTGTFIVICSLTRHQITANGTSFSYLDTSTIAVIAGKHNFSLSTASEWEQKVYASSGLLHERFQLDSGYNGKAIK